MLVWMRQTSLLLLLRKDSGGWANILRVPKRHRRKTNEQHNLAFEESFQALIDLIDSNIDNQMQILSEEDGEESGKCDDED